MGSRPKERAGSLGACPGVMAFACLAVALSTARGEEFPEDLSEGLFQESVLSEEIIDGDQLIVPPEPYRGSYRPRPWYHGRARGGMSYFDLPGDEKTGGTYGVEFAVPLYRAVGIYGSGFANHFDQGTQFLGTVGLYKQGVWGTSYWGDRFGYTVLCDHFTDTRIDDLYLARYRLSLSALVNSRTAVGVAFGDELIGDDLPIPLMPNITVPMGSSRTVSAFISGWTCNKAMLTGTIGYQDIADGINLGGSARIPLSDRLTTFANVLYNDRKLWSALVGLEVRFGPGRGRRNCGTRCRCRCHYHGCAQAGLTVDRETTMGDEYAHDGSGPDGPEVVRGTELWFARNFGPPPGWRFALGSPETQGNPLPPWDNPTTDDVNNGVPHNFYENAAIVEGHGFSTYLCPDGQVFSPGIGCHSPFGP